MKKVIELVLEETEGLNGINAISLVEHPALEHAAELSGLSVVESWIVEDPQKDKTAIYGMELPEGTWMVSMKVNNDDIWNNYVKTGRVKGFSIEGYFVDKMQMESHLERIEEEEAEFMLSNIIA